MIGKIFKWLFLLAFVGAIGYGIYLTAQQVLYRGQVKVVVTNIDTGEPVADAEVVFEEICSEDGECDELFSKTTSQAGIFYASSKEFTDSFNVHAEGYATDGPWTKRPGSLLFTRQYSIGNVYQADLTEDDLTIKLKPEAN